MNNYAQNMHLTEAASVSRICHLCTYFSQYLRIYFVVSEKSCTFAGRNRRSILWYSTFGSSECLLAKPRRGVQNTGGGATPAYSSGDVSPEGAKDPFFRSVTPSGLWQNENGLYRGGSPLPVVLSGLRPLGCALKRNLNYGKKDERPEKGQYRLWQD